MPPLTCSQITTRPNSISLALVQSLTNAVLCLGTILRAGSCEKIPVKVWIIKKSENLWFLFPQESDWLMTCYSCLYLVNAFLSPLGSSIPLQQISLDYLWLYRQFCDTKLASLVSDKASCHLPWVFARTSKFDGKPHMTVNQATKTIEHEWRMVD